jgi:hypothetical protein
VVLATLWPVADASTRIFMTKFYQRCMQGIPCQQALRETKLEFSQSDQYKHPYYWAGFVMVGKDLPFAQNPQANAQTTQIPQGNAQAPQIPQASYPIEICSNEQILPKDCILPKTQELKIIIPSNCYFYGFRKTKNEFAKKYFYKPNEKKSLAFSLQNIIQDEQWFFIALSQKLDSEQEERIVENRRGVVEVPIETKKPVLKIYSLAWPDFSPTLLSSIQLTE